MSGLAKSKNPMKADMTLATYMYRSGDAAVPAAPKSAAPKPAAPKPAAPKPAASLPGSTGDRS
jgi:translation initiation factor IF-2